MRGALVMALMYVLVALGMVAYFTVGPLPEPHVEVELRRLQAENASLEERVAMLEEMVYLAGEERFLLSQAVGSLNCRVDHIVSISRIGWWNKTVLDSLRRCITQEKANE